MLRRKADPNRPSAGDNPFGSGHRSPLGVAAGRGYVEIATLLLDHGANIELADSEKHTPLDNAAAEDADSGPYGRVLEELPPTMGTWCPRRNLVVILLIDAYQKQKKEPPQDSLDKALCWAAGEGAFDTVKRLLDAGANVNARGQYERTPLFQAVFQFHNHSYDNRSAEAEKRKQHLAIIKLLMARGGDPKLGDRNGSALWCAREYRQDQEFVEILEKPSSPPAESGK